MARAVLHTSGTEISHFYFDYLSDAVEIFESAISRLKSCGSSPFNAADATDMAHRIKGNAAMYGYVQLGLQAADVESHLRGLKASSVSETTFQHLTELVGTIQSIMRGEGDPLPPCLPPKTYVRPAAPKTSQQSANQTPRRKHVLIAYKDIWISKLMSSLFEDEFSVEICQSETELLTALNQQKPDLLILENEFGDTDESLFLNSLLNTRLIKDVKMLVAFEPNSAQSIATALSLGIENFVADKYEVLDVVVSAKSILSASAKKVLVVDDDPIVRNLLTHILESKGLEVDTATDGLEALSYLSDKAPDIILLDRFMPRLEGGTVLYEIQNKINLKSIPVLILTAMVNQGEATSWFERGAADFIPKPFDPEEVLMRVMQHLERPQRAG